MDPNIIYKPGDLIVVTETHRVESEKSKNYARTWKKGAPWPYNHPDDLEIPAGQICLVLDQVITFEWMKNLSMVSVLIENPKFGYKHFCTSINARMTKKVS